MGTWDGTSEIGGMSLLPAGIRSFNITKATVEVSDRGAGGKVRELVIGLSCTEGAGETTVPLESTPFGNTPEKVEFWEKVFKTAAVGLGFVPSNGAAPMIDVADEFARWVPVSGLVGSTVEAEVTHHNSTKLKDDGTPFVNHRVKFRGIVGAQQQAAEFVPSFAGSAASDDVWG